MAAHHEVHLESYMVKKLIDHEGTAGTIPGEPQRELS